MLEAKTIVVEPIRCSSDWQTLIVTWNAKVSCANKQCRQKRSHHEISTDVTPTTATPTPTPTPSTHSSKRAKYANLANGFHTVPVLTQTNSIAGCPQSSSSSSFKPVTSILDRSANSPPASPETSFTSSKQFDTNPFRPRRFDVPVVVKSDPDFHEIWSGLVERERLYFADPNYITYHSSMKRRMRSLLADWMIEVSDEFTLHRETYHVAMNFVDRYLSRTHGIHKSNVQLIGVACLFTAAKIQEIYPPRLSRFAELTDGACTDEEILEKEMHILQILQWNLSPVTPIAWVELYMQTTSMISSSKSASSSSSSSSTTPATPPTPTISNKNVFFGACKLLDFATLDYESIRYSPSILAACALYLFNGSNMDMFASTGFNMSQLIPCLKWMMLYALVLEQHESEATDDSSNLERPNMRNSCGAKDDARNIQQHHNFTLQLLEKIVQPVHQQSSSIKIATPVSLQ